MPPQFPKTIERELFPSVGVFWLALMGGLTLVGTAATTVSLAAKSEFTVGYAVAIPLFAAIGVALLWAFRNLARQKTVLYADRVETAAADGTARVLRADEIAGYRWTPLRELCLEPRTAAAKAITVPATIRAEGQGLAWIDALKDLDQAEAERIEAQVLQDPRFGATEADRRAAIARIRAGAGAANIAVVPLFVWTLLSPQREPVRAMLLMLTPLTALAITAWAYPLLRIVPRSRAQADSVMSLYFAPAFLLAFMTRSAAMLDSAWLPALAGAGGIALALVGKRLDPLLRLRSVASVFLVAFSAMYAGGALREANSLFDSAAAAPIETVVRDKYVTGGKNVDHKLVMRPWADGRGENDITVPSELYEAVKTGDRVCIDLHPGALGWRWYDVHACR